MSFNSYAQVHNFESTHLKSTGGAGVGSVLLEESAFLNPAGATFFQLSSFYFQKDSSDLSRNGTNINSPKSLGFVLADKGSGGLSGTLSYTTQEEDIYKRSRLGVSLSSSFSQASSFGISVKKSTDQNFSNNKTEKYYQASLGVVHTSDEKFSVGVLLIDPFKSIAHETKGLFGFQYQLMAYITAIYDIGANYLADDLSSTMLYRGAIQVKVLDDFFLRFGGFKDKDRSETGNGMGISWIQPRLALEFAYKNFTRSKNLSLNLSEDKTKETSFSLSYRF